MNEHAANEKTGQIKRAESLRQQIEQMKAGKLTQPKKENPRAFVDRRMKELAQEKARRRSKE